MLQGCGEDMIKSVTGVLWGYYWECYRGVVEVLLGVLQECDWDLIRSVTGVFWGYDWDCYRGKVRI